MPRSNPNKQRRDYPQVRIMLGSATTLGPGKVKLIEAIGRTGSISAAARELGMSYRRAWVLIDSVNRCFCEPLVETATGGRGGGGTRLTPTCEQVLACYREIEAKATASTRSELSTLSGLMTGGAERE